MVAIFVLVIIENSLKYVRGNPLCTDNLFLAHQVFVIKLAALEIV